MFDGKCGFCRIWIEYWKAITGGRVAYAASQEVGSLYPQIPAKNFSESVQLVTQGGEVLSGARAVFVTLTYAPGMAWLVRRLLWLYDHFPGFAPFTEASYRLIATHRTFFYHLTRLTFGKRILPLKFAKVEWLFLRLLAAIYLIAFASLAVQITGLIGAHGILPLGGYLAAVSRTLGMRGYWSMPTIFWLAHGDGFLRAASIAGVVMALLLLPGILKASWERLLLVCLYILYLSFSTAGQDFLGLAAARNRIPRDLSGQLQIRSAAVSVVAVPPDVSFRCREAHEPRSGMARFQRSRVSLHDAATADAAGLVHVPVAARRSALLHCLHVIHRARDSVSVFRPASLALHWRGTRAVLAGDDFSHRQLHVLQFAHHVAVRVALR
jgi:predicted DCC family thiol-disulfide oxidoreductase YuxK